MSERLCSGSDCLVFWPDSLACPKVSCLVLKVAIVTREGPMREGRWINLSRAEMDSLKRQILMDRPYADRVSFAMAVRVSGMPARGLDSFAVLDELDFLEGHRPVSCSVAATQFKHPPLFPLWHKHFWSARHILRNLIIRWGLDRGGNRDLDKLIGSVLSEYGDDPEGLSGMLADKMVFGGFTERARSGPAATVREVQAGQRRGYGLTGDWIIYGKHSGKNYYLDMAGHTEGETPDDLMAKLRNGSAAEFPFLFL